MKKGEGVYNVVVIGAGTAGLVTAAGTAGLGGRVALIERNLMGGDCLNFGCVPSKALISSARLIQQIRDAEKWGLDRQSPQFVFEKVLDELKKKPESMVVLGGGPIGCELGQAFARLGVRIDMVQSGAQLLPPEDREVAEFMQARFVA